MEERLEHALDRVLDANIIKEDDFSPEISESGEISSLGGQALKHYKRPGITCARETGPDMAENWRN